MPDIRLSQSRRTLLGVAAIVVASALTNPAAGGQTPAPESAQGQQPVFRAGVNFVSVDVFPRREGNVIAGLTLADFQVFEDGKPQKVETFEFIRIESNPADSDRRDPSTTADMDRQARDPRNRIFVVYLDMAHTTIPGSHATQQPVAEFLNRTIGRSDLFGFMTAEIPASQLVLGRRTESIEAQLAKYWTWGQADRIALPRTPAEQRLVECALILETRTGRDLEALLLMLHREELLQTSLENLVARLGDLRDERKNILFISEGWVPRGPREDLDNVSVSEGEIPRVGVGPGGQLGIGRSQQPFNTNFADCDARIRRLSSLDFEKRFRELLERARQANVAFYPVDVGGLRVSSPLLVDGGTRGGPRSTLLTLAENTDGFAVTNTNDLRAGVRSISEDLASFYLLGYYSTNPATDGRFRRIEVKINQPRVDISARRGYYAPTAALMASRAPTSSGPTPVDEALGRLAAARDDAELLVHASGGASGLELVAEVSAAARQRGTGTKGGSVTFTAVASDGAKASATAELVAGESSARASLPDAALDKGPWRVTARLDAGSSPIEARAELPRTAAVLVGLPAAWRGVPSPRVPAKPMADLRLTRSERLRVEWPILDDAATRTARLVDRKGQPLGGPLPFATLAPDRRVAAIDLPISALPEGDFLVELVATKGDVTERRLLAFRVVR
jgi:VWFA-related protein